MKSLKWIVALALATPLAVTPVFADEAGSNQMEQQQEMKLSDLPTPVRTTVNKEAKGKEVSSIKKDQKNGKTVYDVQIGSGTSGQMLQISEAGNVLSRHSMGSESGGAEHNPPSQPNQPSE
jgi:homoaconitase/3-isopropylmalate dehydratase large subunit